MPRFNLIRTHHCQQLVIANSHDNVIKKSNLLRLEALSLVNRWYLHKYIASRFILFKIVRENRVPNFASHTTFASSIAINLSIHVVGGSLYFLRNSSSIFETVFFIVNRDHGETVYHTYHWLLLYIYLLLFFSFLIFSVIVILNSKKIFHLLVAMSTNLT